MEDFNQKATKEIADMIHYVAEDVVKGAPYDKTRNGTIKKVYKNNLTNEIIGYDVKVDDKQYYVKKEHGKGIVVNEHDVVSVHFPCNNVNNIYISNIDANMNIYSTTEKVVGTWIDGKPIYRKVLPFILNTSITTIPHGISNIDNIISVKGGYGYADGIDMYPIPYVALTTSYTIEAGANLSIIYVKAGGSILLGVKCFIIIEYTKTT